ncbi:DUF2092 domain-containing protein [Aquiflexum balticum]|nr:DUF2092 domain-containing protein [Aquiflexum balticum]
MTKKIPILYCILSLVLIYPIRAQESPSIDNNAVVLLDRMSDLIGQLSSCSFKLNASVDKLMPQVGPVKEYFNHQVHFVGPDKMHIQTRGANNHAYWYNGDILMYYSLTYNHYGFIDTHENIIETIDMVNADYGIDFPGADFFYPTFTDDLLANSDKVAYMGLVNIDGVDCHHIVAVGPEQNVQLWLSNDTFTLPLRFVFLDKTEGHSLQYEGVFSDWMINPDLPDAIFDFVVPESAKRLSIVPKTKPN